MLWLRRSRDGGVRKACEAHCFPSSKRSKAGRALRSKALLGSPETQDSTEFLHVLEVKLERRRQMMRPDAPWRHVRTSF